MGVTKPLHWPSLFSVGDLTFQVRVDNDFSGAPMVGQLRSVRWTIFYFDASVA